MRKLLCNRRCVVIIPVRDEAAVGVRHSALSAKTTITSVEFVLLKKSQDACTEAFQRKLTAFADFSLGVMSSFWGNGGTV